jgi:diguanylate cyclase (GGDEF)-like protein
MDSGKDAFTGFYTESYIKEGIEREILRAERYNRQLTFLLFDFEIPQKFKVDMFYPVFKRVCKEIDLHTRRVDSKIRVANRILIVLPETDQWGAHRAATKISETLFGVEFYHPSFDEYFHIRVVYAIGVFPDDGIVSEEIVKKLDARLHAKMQRQTPDGAKEEKEAPPPEEPAG